MPRSPLAVDNKKTMLETIAEREVREAQGFVFSFETPRSRLVEATLRADGYRLRGDDR